MPWTEIQPAVPAVAHVRREWFVAEAVTRPVGVGFAALLMEQLPWGAGEDACSSSAAAARPAASLAIAGARGSRRRSRGFRAEQVIAMGGRDIAPVLKPGVGSTAASIMVLDRAISMRMGDGRDGPEGS